MLSLRWRIAAALPLVALVTAVGAADLPRVHRLARHHVATRSAPPRTVVLAPAAVVAAPEVVIARPPSPTALVLPGTTGVPAFVDLSPVFAGERACGPGFSPDALQTCHRHGELRVDCGPSGRDCSPLSPNPLPYGPGTAARLAY